MQHHYFLFIISAEQLNVHLSVKTGTIERPMTSVKYGCNAKLQSIISKPHSFTGVHAQLLPSLLQAQGGLHCTLPSQLLGTSTFSTGPLTALREV